MTGWRLIDAWSPAAGDLGVDILGPRTITLKNGLTVEAQMVLPMFGNPHGMIVVTDPAIAEALRPAILESWYDIAVAVLPPPGRKMTGPELAKILRTWAWSGSEKGRPEWH